MRPTILAVALSWTVAPLAAQEAEPDSVRASSVPAPSPASASAAAEFKVDGGLTVALERVRDAVGRTPDPFKRHGGESLRDGVAQSQRRLAPPPAAEAIRREFYEPPRGGDDEAYARDLARRVAQGEFQRPPQPTLGHASEPPPLAYTSVAGPLPPELGSAARDTRGSNRRVSLAGQFAGGARDQGQTGTCLTFASVGLLEAAYAREHAIRENFSEMWVIRDLLGRHLSEGPPRSCGRINLGADPVAVLDLAQKKGMCRASSFGFEPYGARLFDAYVDGSACSGDPRKAYDRDVKRFSRYFHAAGDPKLARCEAEATALRPRFASWTAESLAPKGLDDVLAALDLGIPLEATFSGAMSGLSGGAGGHAVLVVGYERKLKSFSIRNSWGAYGQFTAPTLVPWSAFEGARGPSLSDFQAILTLKDKERICQDPAAAPRAWRDRCRSQETP